MKLFLILLTLISSYLLIDVNTYLYSLVILLFLIIIIKNQKLNKKFIFILIVIFVAGLIYRNINLETFQSSHEFTCIVLEKHNKYFICSDGIEKFYVKYDRNDIDLYDLIKINGRYYNLDFITIESEFDFKNYLIHKGINRELYLKSYTTIIDNPINNSIYFNTIKNRINDEFIKNIFSSLYMHDSRALMNDATSLKTNGFYFILVSTGLFLNFIYRSIYNLFYRFLDDKKASIFTFIFILPYAILNIQNISVQRILLTKIVYDFIKFNDLKISAINYKSIPYIVLLTIDKFNIYQYGIIIPLLISFSLYFLNKRTNSYYGIKKFLYLNLVIFLIMVPFLITFSNSINIGHIFINLILLTIMKVVFILFYPLLFMIKLPFIEEIIGFLFNIILKIDLRYLNIYFPSLNQYQFLLYYLIILVFIYFEEIKCKFISSKVILLISSLILIQAVPFNHLNSVEIFFIDIGQGDSTLIRGKHENILIDTGGSLYKDIATTTLIPFFKKERIYKIDTCLITHYDMDHYYALESLQKNFRVDKVYDYNTIYNYKSKEFNLYNLNTYTNLFVDENSKSLVFNFLIKDIRFMLMGDAPMSIENAIIHDPKFKNIHADILKVGHHGSETSSSYEFLKQINPKEAIISCGKRNKYGHPNDVVIDNLNKLNIKVRRTDLEGTISYKIYC